MDATRDKHTQTCKQAHTHTQTHLQASTSCTLKGKHVPWMQHMTHTHMQTGTHTHTHTHARTHSNTPTGIYLMHLGGKHAPWMQHVTNTHMQTHTRTHTLKRTYRHLPHAPRRQACPMDATCGCGWGPSVPSVCAVLPSRSPFPFSCRCSSRSWWCGTAAGSAGGGLRRQW